MSRNDGRPGSLSEFELIDRFFRDCGAKRKDVALGVGDDAALLECAPGQQLVAAIDTMVLGNHFLERFPPQSLGHRALAINLSDLAAMGARPAWALLALTLTRPDEAWLDGFARGFDALAREYDVSLVGGDTTAGPLCISVQVLGHVPPGAALLRSGGRPGDIVFVSGSPGDAACGLSLELERLADEGALPHTQTRAADATGSGQDVLSAAQAAGPAVVEFLRNRFHYPTPRVALGLRLRGHARACIDVSDGLLGDVGKLARSSGCGVRLAWEQLPVSEQLVAAVGQTRARELSLTGGEAYELCFAVAPEQVVRMQDELPPAEWSYTAIGVLTEAPGVVVTREGNVMDFSHSGWDHFGK